MSKIESTHREARVLRVKSDATMSNPSPVERVQIETARDGVFQHVSLTRAEAQSVWAELGVLLTETS